MSAPSTVSRRCTECGAIPRQLDSKFCAYCGAVLPAVTAPAPATPAETRARRFERLRQHPDARRSMALPPSGGDVAARSQASAVPVIVGTVAIAFFGLFVMGGGCSPGPSASFEINGVQFDHTFDRGPDPMGPFRVIVPLVVVGFVITRAAGVLGSSARVASASVRSRHALVVDEHQEERGPQRRRTHMATFEDERGRRSSFELTVSQARELAPGDMGVLHSRGPKLVRFDRVDV